MHQALIDEIQFALIGILATNVPFDHSPNQLYWLEITVIGWSKEDSVTHFLWLLVGSPQGCGVLLDQLLHLCGWHAGWIKLHPLLYQKIDAPPLLLELVLLWNIPSIEDTMVGCIIEHYRRGLVQQVCNELVSEPSDVVVTIERKLCSSLQDDLPSSVDRTPRLIREQALLCPLPLLLLPLVDSVLGLQHREAVTPPLVLLLLVDNILFIIWIEQWVFISVGMLMDVGLICVHLSEPLSWRLGSVGKERAQIVVLLCNIGLRGNKKQDCHGLSAHSCRPLWMPQ
jgi:hypothetical protein